MLRESARNRMQGCVLQAWHSLPYHASHDSPSQSAFSPILAPVGWPTLVYSLARKGITQRQQPLSFSSPLVFTPTTCSARDKGSSFSQSLTQTSHPERRSPCAPRLHCARWSAFVQSLPPNTHPQRRPRRSHVVLPLHSSGLPLLPALMTAELTKGNKPPWTQGHHFSF